MTAPFDEIAFLAQSPNRIAVLRVLCEGPATRSTLRNAVGVSSPTIGRILPDLEHRNWIHRDEHNYEITPLGMMVTEAFTDLRETMDAEKHLREVVRWLPTTQFGFELQCLADATLTVPTNLEPAAPTQRAHELIAGGDRLRTVSHAYNDRGLEAVRTATTEDGLSFEGVFPRSTLQQLITDPDRATMTRDFLNTDDVALYAFDGEIPFSVTVVDERVYFLGRDERESLRSLVETADESVRTWAVSTYEAYRDEASQIDWDELADEAK